MELIEKQPEFVGRFARWHGDEKLAGYPFVDNVHALYDSGGWKGALFWTAEMLQICLRVAKEYIVVPMGLDPDTQFKMVFFVGVGLAIALDAAILQLRLWRARRRASR